MQSTQRKIIPFISQVVFLFSLLLSLSVYAEQTITGKVIKIADGDTLTVRVKNKKFKIRLAEIDTPEKIQPYGSSSRTALVNKVMGKLIQVRITTTDRYKRYIGHIYLNDRHINAEMVKEGHAWVYRRYSNDESLRLLEKQARLAKRGLWALPVDQRQAPWEWRKDRRKNKTISKTNITAKCDSSKRYCKHMTSCKEAMFYLQKCGRTRMDGDNDGVPCESTLCK